MHSELYTKEGYLAEIVSDDQPGEYPLKAEVHYPHGVEIHHYTAKGEFIAGKKSPEDLEL